MIYKEISEFEWDEGNTSKIQERFEIFEVEQFFSQTLMILKDRKHSNLEDRFIAIGTGPLNKPMFVCFTMRQHRIRVISARFMRRKEVIAYEKHKKEF